MKDQNHQGKEFTPKQEWFRRQTPERKWNIIKPFLDIWASAARDKMRVLPSLSAISVAMLIVAALKPDLIGLSIVSTKIILSVLLFLIPSSLIVHILEQEETAKRALKCGGEYQKNFLNIDTRKITWWDKLKEKITGWKNWGRFSSEFPIVVALIYLGIIIYLLYSMWR